MKKFKRIATFVLSMMILFSFVVTHAFANDEVYRQYLETEYSKIVYFHANDETLGSYARVTGDTWTAQDCNIHCRTYVENYHPEGTVWYDLFASAAAVYVFTEYDNGLTGSETKMAKCPKDSDMVYAYATVGSSIDYEPEFECIESFASHHWLLEGYLRYQPDNSEYYYQYEDSETIIIHSDPDYYNEVNIPN